MAQAFLSLLLGGPGLAASGSGWSSSRFLGAPESERDAWRRRRRRCVRGAVSLEHAGDAPAPVIEARSGGARGGRGGGNSGAGDGRQPQKPKSQAGKLSDIADLAKSSGKQLRPASASPTGSNPKAAAEAPPPRKASFGYDSFANALDRQFPSAGLSARDQLAAAEAEEAALRARKVKPGRGGAGAGAAAPPPPAKAGGQRAPTSQAEVYKEFAAKLGTPAWDKLSALKPAVDAQALRAEAAAAQAQAAAAAQGGARPAQGGLEKFRVTKSMSKLIGHQTRGYADPGAEKRVAAPAPEAPRTGRGALAPSALDRPSGSGGGSTGAAVKSLQFRRRHGSSGSAGSSAGGQQRRGPLSPPGIPANLPPRAFLRTPSPEPEAGEGEGEEAGIEPMVLQDEDWVPPADDRDPVPPPPSPRAQAASSPAPAPAPASSAPSSSPPSSSAGRGRVVWNHSTHVRGLVAVLEGLAAVPGVSTITPGVVGRAKSRRTEELAVRVSVSTMSGHKLIARRGRLVQEVFVVTSLGRAELQAAVDAAAAAAAAASAGGASAFSHKEI
eukprot:tig00020553_g10555.t1